MTRAALEAGEYATYVGAAQSFPGYLDALPGYISSTNPAVEDYFFSNQPGESQQKPTTFFRHIAELEESKRTVNATVCDYWIDPDGTANPGPNQLRGAWWVKLSNPGGDPGVPAVADTDARTNDQREHPIPTWNVFGSWKIDKLKYVPIEEIPRSCVDWWQERFPTFVPRNGSNVLDPPEGYVPETMPVAVQYPEWIGPPTS